jgi:hypothetical protein
MNRLITRVLGCVLLALSTKASAGVTTFSGSFNTSWSDARNWNNGVPGIGDRAVISANTTCVISGDVSADTVNVQSNATLEVSYGYSLTLYNDDHNVNPTGADNSIVDGSIVLDVNAYDTKGGSLIFSNDHTLTGSGRVRGVGSANATPTIVIGASQHLWNQIHSSDGSSGIIGSLTIKTAGTSAPSQGHLINDGGTVSVGYNAEHDHHIILTSQLEIGDTSSALWYVNSCKGFMTFNRESISLSGTFNMDHAHRGTFEINQNIKTCGSYSHVGVLTIATGMTFKYATYIDYPTCVNPASPNPSPTCTNPWVVTTSNTCTNCD